MPAGMASSSSSGAETVHSADILRREQRSGGSKRSGGSSVAADCRPTRASNPGTTQWQDVNFTRFSVIGTTFVVGLETALYPMFTVATRMQFENQVCAVELGGHFITTLTCS